MSNKQMRHNQVLHKAIIIISIVRSIIVLDFVYAEGQSYIYASDIFKEKRNDNDMEKPLTFQNNSNPYQPRYRYLPPTQKPGSNPVTTQQHKYQFLPNNNTNSDPYIQKNYYNYPPPIQKLGSNPFIKPND